MSNGVETADQTNDSKWALEGSALWVHNILKVGCLSWIIIDRSEEAAWNGAKKKAQEEGTPEKDISFSSDKWDNCRGIYVLLSTAVLFGIWFWNPGGFWLRMIFGGIAAWRLYEIAVTGLGTALGEDAQLKARNLITIAFYGVQLTLIFAVVYHSFAGGCFEAAVNSKADPHLARSDYLYISWANFTSLGQDAYTAKSVVARFLEVLTTTMGIMLLGVLLAFGINEVRDPTKRKRGAVAQECRDGQTTDEPSPPPTAPADPPPAA